MQRKILGIDVGTAIVGWGIIEQTNNILKHIASGAVLTSSKDDMKLRLKKIYEDLTEIIKLYQPNQVAIESLFFFKNAKTLVTVSQARGVIILTAANQNLPVFDYTPLQVKSSVTGYGKAEKKQVEFMIKKILKLPDVKMLDDIADAIAVSVCHAHNS